METLCLVEGGDFLVGIDVGAIAACRMIEGDFQSMKEFAADGVMVLHLESFLAQHPVPEQHLNLSCVDGTALRLKTGVEEVVLIVDRVVAEVKVAGGKEVLPLLYPSLAKEVCPQVITYKGSAVMIMDVNHVLPVYERLGTGHGLIMGGGGRLSAHQSRNDGEMFKRIVTWTIDHYKRHQVAGSIRISVDDLPSDLAAYSGSNKTMVQYLIDQTIQRCMEKYGHE